MSKSLALTNWHPATWRGLPATQQPTYSDSRALENAVGALSRLPPLVVSWEIEALRDKLAKAQRGEQFLLQGGDCAESFEDCESDNIARRLKILLQMSLVLLQGLKKPVIRVGRFAGQRFSFLRLLTRPPLLPFSRLARLLASLRTKPPNLPKVTG